MARVFNVTAAADSAKLDGSGRGEIPFTVSNASGRPLRGRVEAKIPADPAKQSWISLAGAAERDFPKDGTQQFVVQINAPPGSPEGKYTLRLDVLSVTNPDEDFTQGPTVSFEIAAPKVVKKEFPWWILAVAAAVLLVIGIAVWLLNRTPSQALVPSVKTLTVAQATDLLTKNHFKVQTRNQPTAEAGAGKVLDQDPQPGGMAPTSKPVLLTVGVKGVQLANFRCHEVVSSVLDIQNSHLNPKLEGSGGDTVTDQDPKPLSYAAAGDTVRLNVGARPGNCLVPYQPPPQVYYEQLLPANKAMIQALPPRVER